VARTERTSKRLAEWELRRTEILSAAIELIAERGYSGTTMQAISSRVGCSVGYLYRHFNGKLALARVLVDREIGQFERIASHVHELGLSPMATYRRLLEELSRYLIDRRALVRVFTRETVLRHLPEADRRLCNLRGRDRDLLARAVACGELRELDPDLMSVVLHSIVDALMSHLAGQENPQALVRLPDIVFSLIIDPLRPGAGEHPTKED